MLMGQWCISVVRNSMECGHKRKNCCEFRLAMANDMKEDVMKADYKNWVPKGMFMSKWESTWMALTGSAILMGRK